MIVVTTPEPNDIFGFEYAPYPAYFKYNLKNVLNKILGVYQELSSIPVGDDLFEYARYWVLFLEDLIIKSEAGYVDKIDENEILSSLNEINSDIKHSIEIKSHDDVSKNIVRYQMILEML